MGYKITSIYADQVQKVTTGAKPDVDTILGPPTVNTDKSHTDDYYLIVSVAFEYDSKRGLGSSTLSKEAFKIFTAEFDSEGKCVSATPGDTPTKDQIVTKANEMVVEYINSLDLTDYTRSTVEEIRQTVALYDFPSEDLKPGVGV